MSFTDFTQQWWGSRQPQKPSLLSSESRAPQKPSQGPNPPEKPKGLQDTQILAQVPDAKEIAKGLKQHSAVLKQFGMDLHKVMSFKAFVRLNRMLIAERARMLRRRTEQEFAKSYKILHEKDKQLASELKAFAVQYKNDFLAEIRKLLLSSEKSLLVDLMQKMDSPLITLQTYKTLVLQKIQDQKLKFSEPTGLRMSSFAIQEWERNIVQAWEILSKQIVSKVNEKLALFKQEAQARVQRKQLKKQPSVSESAMLSTFEQEQQLLQQMLALELSNDEDEDDDYQMEWRQLFSNMIRAFVYQCMTQGNILFQLKESSRVQALQSFQATPGGRQSLVFQQEQKEMEELLQAQRNLSQKLKQDQLEMEQKVQHVLTLLKSVADESKHSYIQQIASILKESDKWNPALYSMKHNDPSLSCSKLRRDGFELTPAQKWGATLLGPFLPPNILRGIAFSWAPGTGKTKTIQAGVVEQLLYAFIYLPDSEFVSSPIANSKSSALLMASTLGEIQNLAHEWTDVVVPYLKAGPLKGYDVEFYNNLLEASSSSSRVFCVKYTPKSILQQTPLSSSSSLSVFNVETNDNANNVNSAKLAQGPSRYFVLVIQLLSQQDPALFAKSLTLGDNTSIHLPKHGWGEFDARLVRAFQKRAVKYFKHYTEWKNGDVSTLPEQFWQELEAFFEQVRTSWLTEVFVWEMEVMDETLKRQYMIRTYCQILVVFKVASMSVFPSQGLVVVDESHRMFTMDSYSDVPTLDYNYRLMYMLQMRHSQCKVGFFTGTPNPVDEASNDIFALVQMFHLLRPLSKDDLLSIQEESIRKAMVFALQYLPPEELSPPQYWDEENDPEYYKAQMVLFGNQSKWFQQQHQQHLELVNQWTVEQKDVYQKFFRRWTFGLTSHLSLAEHNSFPVLKSFRKNICPPLVASFENSLTLKSVQWNLDALFTELELNNIQSKINANTLKREIDENYPFLEYQQVEYFFNLCQKRPKEVVTQLRQKQLKALATKDLDMMSPTFVALEDMEPDVKFEHDVATGLRSPLLYHLSGLVSREEYKDIPQLLEKDSSLISNFGHLFGPLPLSEILNYVYKGYPDDLKKKSKLSQEEWVNKLHKTVYGSEFKDFQLTLPIKLQVLAALIRGFTNPSKTRAFVYHGSSELESIAKDNHPHYFAVVRCMKEQLEQAFSGATCVTPFTKQELESSGKQKSDWSVWKDEVVQQVQGATKSVIVLHVYSKSVQRKEFLVEEIWNNSEFQDRQQQPWVFFGDQTTQRSISLMETRYLISLGELENQRQFLSRPLRFCSIQEDDGNRPEVSWLHIVHPNDAVQKLTKFASLYFWEDQDKSRQSLTTLSLQTMQTTSIDCPLFRDFHSGKDNPVVCDVELKTETEPDNHLKELYKQLFVFHKKRVSDLAFEWVATPLATSKDLTGETLDLTSAYSATDSMTLAYLFYKAHDPLQVLLGNNIKIANLEEELKTRRDKAVKGWNSFFEQHTAALSQMKGKIEQYYRTYWKQSGELKEFVRIIGMLSKVQMVDTNGYLTKYEMPWNELAKRMGARNVYEEVFAKWFLFKLVLSHRLNPKVIGSYREFIQLLIQRFYDNAQVQIVERLEMQYKAATLGLFSESLDTFILKTKKQKD